MTLRAATLIALAAIALAVFVVAYRPHRRVDAERAVRDRAPDGSPAVAPVSEPVVVTAEHAIESTLWRPDGHLLLLTPEELVDVDPDAPLPARRVSLRGGRRLRGAGSAFVIERTDGWESWDTLTFERLASGNSGNSGDSGDSGAGGTELALSGDGRFLATPTCEEDAGSSGCHFTVVDVRTGEVRARMPAGRDARSAGTFSFLSGGAAGSAWAALLSAGELTVVDFLDGTVHLRRKLRRTGEDGRSRELLEIRGKRAYLTSAYGFEVVDLPRGLTLVRERDPQEDTDVTFAVSDDGATVTEASTFAETLVTTWEVPAGANAARSAAAVLPVTADGTSPDGRYLASLRAGTLRLTSLRSGAEVLHLGAPGDAPVDMFRKLAMVGGVPVLRDAKGRQLVLSTARAVAADDVDDASAASPPPIPMAPPPAPPAPPGTLLAAQDARFAYFVGTEHDDQAAALLPILRVDRRTGGTIPVFAAQRSAVAQFPDRAVEIFGDEEEAQESIVCATETTWLPARSCLNVFLAEGRFDAARGASGHHATESVR